jgi:hypothetical protein
MPQSTAKMDLPTKRMWSLGRMVSTALQGVNLGEMQSWPMMARSSRLTRRVSIIEQNLVTILTVLGLFAEYKCLFGISKPMADFPPGSNHTIHDKGRSILLIVGKGGILYWFYFLRMDKVYRPPDIPRFNQVDVDTLMEKEGDLPLVEKGRVTVRDLYENRRIATLLVLEEAEYKHWGWGRITCVGDSIHKATPNLGAMGNTAMESAAALANVLKRLEDKPSVGSYHSLETVRAGLDDYQRRREVRAHRIVKMANDVTRYQALDNLTGRLLTNYLMKVRSIALRAF